MIQKDMTTEIVELIVEILNDHSENGRSITIREACALTYQLLPNLWL